MADDTDNLVLQLLREMRQEQADFREEMRAFRSDTDERLDTLETQMQGVGGMLTLIYGRLIEHDDRLSVLEGTSKP